MNSSVNSYALSYICFIGFLSILWKIAIFTNLRHSCWISGSSEKEVLKRQYNATIINFIILFLDTIIFLCWLSNMYLIIFVAPDFNFLILFLIKSSIRKPFWVLFEQKCCLIFRMKNKMDSLCSIGCQFLQVEVSPKSLLWTLMNVV